MLGLTLSYMEQGAPNRVVGCSISKNTILHDGHGKIDSNKVATELYLFQ